METKTTQRRKFAKELVELEHCGVPGLVGRAQTPLIKWWTSRYTVGGNHHEEQRFCQAHAPCSPDHSVWCLGECGVQLRRQVSAGSKEAVHARGLTPAP